LYTLSCIVRETFNVEQWHALEIWVDSYSRSLKMTAFDRSYATFYQSVIAGIAVTCIIFELLDVEKYRDLEI